MSFTLFIILPNKDVCSLRHLASGTYIREVRNKLELSAGLPAQTYRLTCPEGLVLHEDHVLKMDVNVWDGYVVRAVFLDSWRELYDHILANNVNHVIKYGAVYMRSDVVWMDGEEEGRAKEVVKERGVVALFIASFLGMQEMVKALLAVDVNPNGKTPFGRTPLFAAMLRDHDVIMGLLLSHHALLTARDYDGVTAIDVARRETAKQCLRKIRHMQLHTVGDTVNAAYTMPQAQVKRKGPRVIRIPSGATTHRESTFSSTSSGRPKQSHPDYPDKAPAQNFEPYPDYEYEERASPPRSSYPVQRHPRVPQPRPLFRQDRDGQMYCWENNVAPASRGTPVRYMTSSSMSQLKRGSQSKQGTSISWNDNVSVSSSPRMLPLRPTVQDLSTKGPSSVLTTSSSTSSLAPTMVSYRSLQQDDRNKTRKPSALLRFFAQSPHFHESSTTFFSSELDDQQDSGLVGVNSALGSQETLSVGSAPDPLLAPGGAPSEGETGGGGGEPTQGESDDDGGRVIISRGKGSRSSSRFRTRAIVSRQKQQESWKTMKRRITLAEEQKRNSNGKPQHNGKSDKEVKENFEQWLDRKRKEQHSTDDETSEDDDESAMNRTAENSQAFNDWLKDLRGRPSRPQTSSLVLSQRRKGRPQKHLIEMGGHTQADATTPQEDPNSYMLAYRQWQHRKKRGDDWAPLSVQDIETAKQEVEDKRKSLLAMALTYQDWMEHTEARKKLMQAILRADLEKLAAIEQHLFNTKRAPRQISFNEWREKHDKKEAEVRHQRQRMRKEAELRNRNGMVGNEVIKTNAAVPHEEWLRQKKEASRKERNTSKPATEGEMSDPGVVSEDEKERVLEEWLEHKHRHEMSRLGKSVQQERQLLFNLPRKKQPTVTQC